MRTKKDAITNILAGIIAFLTGGYAALAAMNGDEIDWVKVIMGAVVALISWATGKDDNLKKAVKSFLIIFLPALIIINIAACSAVPSVVNNTDDSVSVGVDELDDFVDVYYLTCEAIVRVSDGEKITLQMIYPFVPVVLSIIDDYDLLLAELKNLTDNEIIMLVNKGDEYRLGTAAVKFKQVLKEILFKIQSGMIFFDKETGALILYENKIYWLGGRYA